MTDKDDKSIPRFAEADGIFEVLVRPGGRRRVRLEHIYGLTFEEMDAEYERYRKLMGEEELGGAEYVVEYGGDPGFINAITILLDKFTARALIKLSHELEEAGELPCSYHFPIVLNAEFGFVTFLTWKEVRDVVDTFAAWNEAEPGGLNYHDPRGSYKQMRFARRIPADNKKIEVSEWVPDTHV